METIRYEPSSLISQADLCKATGEATHTIMNHRDRIVEAGHGFIIHSKPPRYFFYKSAIEWLNNPGNRRRTGRPHHEYQPGTLAHQIEKAGLLVETVRMATCAGTPQSTFREYVGIPTEKMTPRVITQSKSIREKVEKYLSRRR